LDGSGGNDSIFGGDGVDSLTGGTGNDRILGEGGNDTFADSALNTEFEDGGAGDDTFTVAAVGNLTSADTIIGGDGTDTLVFADTTSVNLTTDITALTNVSGVEVIAVSGMNGTDTLTVNDGVVSAAGGALTLRFVTGVTGANTVDASGVLATVSSVTFSDLAGLGSTYVIGNGKDSATMGDGNDAVTVSNNAFLSASDTLAGGSGTDTVTFSSQTNTTFTAAQLSNISGFETFAIATGGGGNYSLTLTDAIVSAQVSAGATFTVSRGVGTADTGTTNLNGSAVSASFNLDLVGEAGSGTAADTLIGGAGSDTLNGGLGVDTLTGGAGNDTFTISATAQAGDIVTDFDFGTSTTFVDRYNFSGFVVPTTAFDDGFDTVTLTSGLAATATIADDTDVFVINDQGVL
jgi:Ca2+-binding RTX toxin-like protein